MTIGMRIRKIREFRGLTQKELGIRCGFTENSADVRIRQYEADSKVPREDTLRIIAKALDVNYTAIKNYSNGSAEDILETLFWLEEMTSSVILFGFKKEYDSSGEWLFDANYNDFNYMASNKPIGINITYGLVNDFMGEWLIRQTELKNKEITREEYFEWKINWPESADDCGKFEPIKKWRK
jgi:transcriptional regulator with XRE-family HTH domain